MSSTTPLTRINVGTRRSALAMRQAEIVAADLGKLNPEIKFDIHGMATAGDKDQTTALYNFTGKGLWTSELEAKLATGELDIIVHCLKDLPTVIPDGFDLGCITAREDPRDVLVLKAGLAKSHGYKSLDDLPNGSVIGTSSIRRIAQLRRRYPGLQFADMRGNIQTRLSKLDAEDSPFTALILAAAGLLRMQYDERITQYLDSSNGGMLYAVGQGALAIEARSGDENVLAMLRGYQDNKTFLACVAERTVMRTLEGGCSVPIGVETSWSDDGKLVLRATVVSVDGKMAADTTLEAPVSTEEEADSLGKKAAQDLLDRGAGEILSVINRAQPLAQKEVAAPATAAA